MTDQKKPGRLRHIGRGIRKITGSTSELVGGKAIRENASLIVALWQLLRSRQQENYTISQHEKKIDIEETAFKCGLSQEAFISRVERRTRETASKSRMFFLFGLFLTLCWSYQLLFGEWTTSRFIMGLLVMIFPLCMFSLSLIYAWENWQIRNLYMGTFPEFIQNLYFISKNYINDLHLDVGHTFLCLLI